MSTEAEDYDRARIKHHFRTWINSQVSKEIGHNGLMSLEELCHHLEQLEGVIPDAPFPSVQVAKGDGSFVWNEDSIQEVLQEAWKMKKLVLTGVHLTVNAQRRWDSLDRSEAVRLSNLYARAVRESRLASKRGMGLTVDKSLKRLRTLTAMAKPISTPFGRTITVGVCLTCADCMTCHGARDNAVKCNDYVTVASKRTPVKGSQIGPRATFEGGEGKRTAPPLLHCGI